jgi:hypothetical protein
LLKYGTSAHLPQLLFWSLVMLNYLMRVLGLPNGGGWA